MTELRVQGRSGHGLRGRVRVPGDKSISHRSLLLAALAEGSSRITGLSSGSDVARTAGAVAAMGAEVTRHRGDEIVVAGGLDRLHEPEAVIDVGNSATGIRLLAGWCAARPWLTVLQGDESIAQRPMDRVVAPLRQMGANVDARADGSLPPVVVRGGQLHGIDYQLPVASAQVKGAVLLAGLSAAGETVVRETTPTRAHTEEMLAASGADVTVEPGLVRLKASLLRPFDLHVPGDPSQAAFWVVGACIIPGSDLVVERIYLGPARAGFLDVLGRMGADITLEDHDVDAQVASVRVRYHPLVATEVGGTEVPGLIDEIPVLAVAAAVATGTTTFSGASELRVKESDRIASVTGGLRALGVTVEPTADGLVVHGSASRALQPGRADAHGDHRIAMALAVAALTAEGPSTITGWDAVATSYPGFEEDLLRCAS